MVGKDTPHTEDSHIRSSPPDVCRMQNNVMSYNNKLKTNKLRFDNDTNLQEENDLRMAERLQEEERQRIFSFCFLTDNQLK